MRVTRERNLKQMSTSPTRANPFDEGSPSVATIAASESSSLTQSAVSSTQPIGGAVVAQPPLPASSPPPPPPPPPPPAYPPPPSHVSSFSSSTASSELNAVASSTAVNVAPGLGFQSNNNSVHTQHFQQSSSLSSNPRHQYHHQHAHQYHSHSYQSSQYPAYYQQQPHHHSQARSRSSAHNSYSHPQHNGSHAAPSFTRGQQWLSAHNSVQSSQSNESQEHGVSNPSRDDAHRDAATDSSNNWRQASFGLDPSAIASENSFSSKNGAQIPPPPLIGPPKPGNEFSAGGQQQWQQQQWQHPPQQQNSMNPSYTPSDSRAPVDAKSLFSRAPFKPKNAFTMIEMTETGLEVSYGKGFAMLKKSGFVPGQAIGRKKQGITAPVAVAFNLGQSGLGYKKAPKKREARIVGPDGKTEKQRRHEMQQAEEKRLAAERRARKKAENLERHRRHQEEARRQKADRLLQKAGMSHGSTNKQRSWESSSAPVFRSSSGEQYGAAADASDSWNQAQYYQISASGNHSSVDNGWDSMKRKRESQ